VFVCLQGAGPYKAVRSPIEKHSRFCSYEVRIVLALMQGAFHCLRSFLSFPLICHHPSPCSVCYVWPELAYMTKQGPQNTFRGTCGLVRAKSACASSALQKWKYVNRQRRVHLRRGWCSALDLCYLQLEPFIEWYDRMRQNRGLQCQLCLLPGHTRKCLDLLSSCCADGALAV